MRPVTVPIHSPLVGPLTWSLVGQSLEEHGFPTLVPEIHSQNVAPVYWLRHASDVANALVTIPPDISVVLVAHSGAGPLLPAIRQMLPHPVTGYVFVDAGIPLDGLSRLDLMRQESPEMADQLLKHLESGGRFPEWSEDDLHDIVPDDNLRAALVSDLRPQLLKFFTEPIPVFAGWPDAACSYIQITPTYIVFADRAREAGWPIHTIEGGHFHMLVNPEEVAAALRSLALFK